MSYLFAFEGTDGTGKSTIMQQVAENLKKYVDSEVVMTYEPGGPPGRNVGRIIRNTLLDIDNKINSRTELLLFLADRADHLEKFIVPNLKEGKIVLTDRFWESSLVYQVITQEVINPQDLYFLHHILHEEVIFPTKTFIFTSEKPHSIDEDRMDKKMREKREDMNGIYQNISSFPFINYPVVNIDTTNEMWGQYRSLIMDKILETLFVDNEKKENEEKI